MVILPHLKRLVGSPVKELRARFLQWTKPLTSSLPLQTLADLRRSRSELVAENALLRQQLIILKRQVKRPACTNKDRVLLLLLARLVHTWQNALLIVQPDTRLAVASGALSGALEAQIQGAREKAEALVRDDQLDQRDGSKQPTLGGRADPGRAAQAGYEGEQTNHPEVYEANSPKTAGRTELENVL